MPLKPILFLLFLAGFICVVDGSFDCRRRGQTCQNGGTCPDNNSTCECMDGWEGYDCSVNTTLIGVGACNWTECDNGGTCIGGEDNSTFCACPPEFYGKTCSFRRYQVTCKSGSLLVGINPHGKFSGFIYVEDKRDSCSFGNVSTVSDNRTMEWEGYGKDILNDDDNCSKIEAVYTPPKQENVTMPENSTTSYTRVIYVVYEKTFLTSLDEVLTFTCIFNTESVVIEQSAESNTLEAKHLNQQTTTATLSPVKFDIVKAAGTGSGNKVTLGEELTMRFTVDSNSFAAARLEYCVFNDTEENGDSLVTVDNSCVQDDAKSILSDPIRYEDDNSTITIAMKIRVFKFVKSNKLGITCKVKACPIKYGAMCTPNEASKSKIGANQVAQFVLLQGLVARNTYDQLSAKRDCKNVLGNPTGFGRRRRDAPEPAYTEIGRILHVGDTSQPEDTKTETDKDKDEPISIPTCNMAKEVAAIMTALGTVTLVLLIVTIVLMSRAVVTSQNSKAKAKDERSDTYSNLGQPKAFSRKH